MQRKNIKSFSLTSVRGILCIKIKQISLAVIFCLVTFIPGSNARAGLTIVTGVPVPELAAFDNAMITLMQQNGLGAGVLAISRNGCVVYQRGFGQDTEPVRAIPENMPMRLASVEKPLTAAVIRDLAANSDISLNDFVFDLPDQPTPGLLPSSTYFPYDGMLGDPRLADITVNDLLLHRGGWDRGVTYDPMYKCIWIGDQVNKYPPGRENITKFMLSESLQYNPGTLPCERDDNDVCQNNPTGCYCGDMYSNFGFMLLSLIIEEVTGDNVTANVRNRILTPDMWVPSTEVFTGKTFDSEQNPREPYYITTTSLAENCFNPHNDPTDYVSRPYGGWDQWALQGHGNAVASAAPLLTYLDNYVVIGDNIGRPYVPSGASGWMAHGGAMDGTNSVAVQRGDGINFVVLLNKRDDDALGDIFNEVLRIINDTINPITWPTSCVDGFWVDFDASSSGFGGYSDPFHTMDTTLNAVTDGTKLRIKEGTSNWTGTISTRTMIDAPFGEVTIGQ